MNLTEKDIELVLRKKFLTEILSDASLRKIGKELEVALLKIQRDRTDDGYDIYGRKFGGYNKSYNKAKAFVYASKRYGTAEFSGSPSTTGKRTPLRLTGQLFSGMIVKFLGVDKQGTKVIFKFKFTVKDDQLKKAEGLQSETGTTRSGSTYSKKSWMFMGLSVSGSNVQQESNIIKSIIQKNSKLILERIKK